MYNVNFSGFIGLLIWILLFANSTAGLALVFRGVWMPDRRRLMAVGFADRPPPLSKEAQLLTEIRDLLKK
jgi:large-conductance mechanosensitive channel